MTGRGYRSKYGWIPEEMIHEANWRQRVGQMKSAPEPFPPPRPIGVCKVPPDGKYWFHRDARQRYNPERDGPLVDCEYPTARVR